MSQNELKTAIKSAEERLENERAERLKQEVYEFLKQELESVDKIDADIRKLNEQKRVHEENIKNVKSGNLEAIEKRRQSLNQLPQFTFTTLTTGNAIGNWTATSGSNRWFNTYVAGTTITTTAGKTYIF